MNKFEVNKKYYGRSSCDYNCIFEMEVIKRTEKTIKANVDGSIKTLRIKTDDENEFVYPYSKYSMCPIIRAERILL